MKDRYTNIYKTKIKRKKARMDGWTGKSNYECIVLLILGVYK